MSGRVLPYLFLFSSCLSILSCAQRSYTKPHSEIVREAQRAGKEVRTLEEEKLVFQKHSEHNRNKLYSLLKSRGVETGASSGAGSLDGNYVLGPSDVVQVSVFGVDELNTNVKISQSGEVNLPLIGTVKLAGLTESEATQLLKRSLSRHLRDPQVIISVAEYGGHEVSILGSVATPGKVALRKGRTNLLEVLGAAGGVTKEAGNYLTLVPSTSNSSADDLVQIAKQSLEVVDVPSLNQEKGIEIPLAAVMGLNNNPPIQVPLRGGDIIVVQPAGQVLVEGEVDRRGAITLGENGTLVGALAAAGGISYGANYSEIEIIRKISNSDKVTLVYNLESIQSGTEENPLLKNGDIIRVPSANGKRFSQDVFRALQGFINLGVGRAL